MSDLLENIFDLLENIFWGIFIVAFVSVVLFVIGLLAIIAIACWKITLPILILGIIVGILMTIVT